MTVRSTLPSPARELTAAQARRTAIAAQLLHRPRRHITPNRGHLRRLVDRLGVLQIDSVNVLARAHYLPVYSRLGGYRTQLLDEAAWPRASRQRVLLESWAHVASLISVDTEPLLRWRQRRMADAEYPASVLDRHPGLDEQVLQAIAEHGPVSAGEVEKILEAPGRGKPGWWEWSATKQICEYLFVAGRTAVADRRGFERRYDLAERVIPAPVLATPTPDPDDAKRQLVERAVAHHGIGTAGDIADYYRLRVADTKRTLAELAEQKVVQHVRVRGWDEPAWLHTAAGLPRTATGSALLCPFDPLIWHRPRTERIFGVRYRIEIYTPAAKRVHGYYVFLLLDGDRLAARLDLKADRADRRLLVQSSWLIPGADSGRTAHTAAAELVTMAAWLGLDDVTVRPRGDLASALAAPVAAATA